MALYATKRLMGTTDGKLVDEDDPDAAFLVASEGSEIDQDMVDKYSITGRTAGVSSTDPATKATDQPADKQAEAPANKSK